MVIKIQYLMKSDSFKKLFVYTIYASLIEIEQLLDFLITSKIEVVQHKYKAMVARYLQITMLQLRNHRKSSMQVGKVIYKLDWKNTIESIIQGDQDLPENFILFSSKSFGRIICYDSNKQQYCYDYLLQINTL